MKLTAHAFVYDGVVRDIVHAYKFKSWYYLAEGAALSLAGVLSKLGPDFQDAPIVPVPSHPLRWLRRRFDPVAFLSHRTAQISGRSVSHLLRRKHSGVPQSRLPASERRTLPVSTFTFRGREAPGRAILVDDVFTTGSTVTACTKILMQGGVHHVAVVTFARTEAP